MNNENLILKNKRNFLKIGIFTFPIILVIFLVILNSIFENNYFSYNTIYLEDGPVEYATFIFYLLSSIISVFISAIFIKTDKKLFGVLYLILFGFFIFVALEEISWGQRIFELETPDLFSSNIQNEINFHSLPMMYVYGVPYYTIMVTVIGIIGTFGWVLHLIKSNTKYNFFVRHFIPKWYFATYFFPGIIFSIPFHHLEFNPLIPEIIQELLRYAGDEAAEFFISLAIFVFVLSIFFKSILRYRKYIKPEKRKEKMSTQRRLVLIAIIAIIIPSLAIVSVYFYDEYFLMSSLYGKELHGNNFQGQDLQNAIFSYSDLTHVNFEDANLEGADFHFAKMDNVNLKNAYLKNAKLSRTTINDADLFDAELSGADLSRAKIKYTDFSRANFKDANFRDTQLIAIKADNTNFENADFTKSIILGVDFTNSKLSGTNFEAAQIYYVDFSGEDVSSVMFSSTFSKSTELAGSNLQYADLTNVNLAGVDFTGKYLPNVGSLGGTNLYGANLAGVDLSKVLFYTYDGMDMEHAKRFGPNLSEANLSGVNLSDRNLTVVNFSNANLSNAILINANLTLADLSSANLSYTDLTNANLLNANLEGVILDGTILDCINHPICN